MKLEKLHFWEKKQKLKLRLSMCVYQSPTVGARGLVDLMISRLIYIEIHMKEGRKCFNNDALNTFYLRLYGVRHMVKYHTDSERGNPLPPYGLHFRLTANALLYAPSLRQECTYHGLCYTSRGALTGTRNKIHMINLLG